MIYKGHVMVSAIKSSACYLVSLETHASVSLGQSESCPASTIMEACERSEAFITSAGLRLNHSVRQLRI